MSTIALSGLAALDPSAVSTAATRRKKLQPLSSQLTVLLLVSSMICVSSSSAQSNHAPITQEHLDSEVVLRDSPQAQKYFDVTGRKSAVFGRQNGSLEAWIYPIKLLHGFRLEFQPQQMLDPVRGESLLCQVITRPESTTLVYVHPNFTAREIIWAPLSEAAIFVQLEVESPQPVEITAAFVPDFRPMWPASFGGQHSDWLAEENALLLADGTFKPTALIGSPAITAHAEHVDHQLGAGEMKLRFHYRPGDPGSLSEPLVMALSMESEAKARSLYQNVRQNRAHLFEERILAHKQLLGRTLVVETPDAEINRDFTWAKFALDSGWICKEEFGCGLVAGYGPSEAGERPGFAWWFGGDALMASWALEDYGDLSGALQALRFLKSRQRSDGKMLHELSQSAGLIDWFAKYGYAYYHADTTPMYLYSIDQYWRRTGDRQFLEEFWPSAKQAYDYCVSTLSPEDGLMDNTKAGLAAVEVGALRGKVVKDVYLEGFWLAAAEAMADLAAARAEKEIAAEASTRAQKAGESLKKNWWSDALGTFAFGQTADGQRAELAGAWPAIALALGSHLDAAQAKQAAKALASPKLRTDWGIRWLANDDQLYDPLSYNNGSVWPFISGIAAWAEYRQGLSVDGFQHWKSLANLTGLSSPGMLPELMNGDRFLPGEFAVPHQLFSSVGVVLPLVRGVLGIESDASVAGPVVLRLRPNLPPDWAFLRFRNYPLAGGKVSGEIQQDLGRTILRLSNDGASPIAVASAPAIPALARISKVEANGKPQRYSAFEAGNFVRVEIPSVTLPPSTTLTLSVEYQGGIGIVPPFAEPHPGEQSSSLRVLDVQTDAPKRDCAMKVVLAGLAGREYGLRLITGLQQLHAGKLEVRKADRGFEIRVPFDGTGYVTRSICLAE